MFDVDDGHYDSYKINYMAYSGEDSIFHSDIEISGWTLAGDVSGLSAAAKGKVYVAHLPKLPLGNNVFIRSMKMGRSKPVLVPKALNLQGQ